MNNSFKVKNIFKTTDEKVLKDVITKKVENILNDMLRLEKIDNPTKSA